MAYKFVEKLKIEKNRRLAILKDGAELWLNAQDASSMDFKYKDQQFSENDKINMLAKAKNLFSKNDIHREDMYVEKWNCQLTKNSLGVYDNRPTYPQIGKQPLLNFDKFKKGQNTVFFSL